MMHASHLMLILLVMAASSAIADDNLNESKAIEKIELLGGKVTRDDPLLGRASIGIYFQGRKWFNQKHLHLLKRLNNLTSLDLNGIKITDAGVKEISELKQLATLSLIGTEVTLEGVKELKKSLPNTKINYADPDEFEAIRKIEQLGGTVESEDRLPGHPVIGVDLCTFKPHETEKFDDQFVHLLNRFASLKYLTLTNTGITDHGLKKLKGPKNLMTLDLKLTKIADPGVREIIEYKNLIWLSLNSTGITDQGLREIKELKNLRHLDLTNTTITDVGLSELKDVKQLFSLDLNSCKRITDEGMKEIINLGYLSFLNLNETGITDIGLSELKKLTNLSYLYLEGLMISDVGLKELSGLKSLTSLNLHRCINITDEGVAELKQALPTLKIVR